MINVIVTLHYFGRPLLNTPTNFEKSTKFIKFDAQNHISRKVILRVYWEK